MQRLFITSTGTGIGKTLIMASLCWQFRQKQRQVTALKPVMTGYDPSDMQNDAALILQSCGVQPTPALISAVSPWRYAAPLAPSMAAAREKLPPPAVEKLVAFCREHERLENALLLAEGVGGVMAPLNEKETVLDWIEQLGWPVALVVGTYLGSLSHTLTALEALSARRVALKAVVMCASEGSPVPMMETVRTLEHFTCDAISLVKIPRLHGKAERWKQAPLISWICE